MMTKDFYTYAYLREAGTPYYIGKGKGRRAFSTQHGVNKPTEDRVLFLKTSLTEEEAFRHETYLISVLGRKDLGTGMLRNRSEGGAGTTGRILSQENKDKLSILMKDKNPMHNPEVSQRVAKLNTGRKQSKETIEKRKKTIKSMGGYKHTEERKEKIRQARLDYWKKRKGT